MAKISQIRYCYNCGAVLQSSDPTKEGYVKKETLDNDSQNFIFCDKCFEIERHRPSSNEPFVDDEYLTMLKKAKNDDALIVYLVNLFSFEASFCSEINKIIQGMNILVVANKFDLLPSGTKEEATIDYVSQYFSNYGINLKKENILLASAFDDETAKLIISTIFENKNGKDVYIIGSSQAGKTTLVSSFLRVYKNLSTGNIVIQEFPGTKLRVMQIPLNSKTKMYDTPGISMSNSVLNGLDKKTFESIYLTEPVEAKDISFSEGQAIYFGGLAFVQLISGEKTTLSCYMHPDIQYKKENSKKAESKFIELIAKDSISPSLKRIKSIKDMDVFEVDINESDMRDIGIQGLGWFSFLANNQIFRIYVPRGVSIYTSKPKVISNK